MKLNAHTIGLLLMLDMALNGCDQVDRGTDDAGKIAADVEAIKALEQQYAMAFQDRDWETFSGFFEPDGIWMPPERFPLVGKEAWWSFHSESWDVVSVPVAELHTEEVMVLGDWAIERHSEKMVIDAPSLDEPFVGYYKGVHLLRRQTDGSWKIARYVWNNNPPPD